MILKAIIFLQNIILGQLKWTKQRKNTSSVLHILTNFSTSGGHDSHTIFLIQTKKLRAEIVPPLTCLTKPAWATIWMSSKLKGAVLTLMGFLLWLVALMCSWHILLLQMAVCSFCSGEERDFDWLGVWGLNPERFRHVGTKPLQTGGAGRWGSYFSQRSPWLGEGERSHAVSFNYTLACTLQLKKITNNLSWDNWRVLGTVYSHSVQVKVSLNTNFIIY